MLSGNFKAPKYGMGFFFFFFFWGGGWLSFGPGIFLSFVEGPRNLFGF